MVKAGAHAPKVISVASYALAMGSGALRGAVAGIPLSWPGMIGGAVVGAGIGYGTVKLSGMAFEAAANYSQAKLNEFADYAESIGRNETESRRNRYVADAIGSTIFTTINAISLIKGVKAVSKTTLSALDLAAPPKRVVVNKESFTPNSTITPLDKPGRVMFDGVEFRAIRDLSHVSVEHLKKMLKTGANPYDRNKKNLNLHHYKQIPQREKGAAYIHIPENKHNIWNTVQHPKGNKKGAGLTPSQRKDSDNLKRAFNKELARNELEKRNKP